MRYFPPAPLSGPGPPMSVTKRKYASLTLEHYIIDFNDFELILIRFILYFTMIYELEEWPFQDQHQQELQ